MSNPLNIFRPDRTHRYFGPGLVVCSEVSLAWTPWSEAWLQARHRANLRGIGIPRLPLYQTGLPFSPSDWHASCRKGTRYTHQVLQSPFCRGRSYFNSLGFGLLHLLPWRGGIWPSHISGQPGNVTLPCWGGTEAWDWHLLRTQTNPYACWVTVTVTEI